MNESGRGPRPRRHESRTCLAQRARLGESSLTEASSNHEGKSMHIRWIVLAGLLATLAVSPARASEDGLVTRPSKHTVAEPIALRPGCGRPGPPCSRASI